MRMVMVASVLAFASVSAAAEEPVWNWESDLDRSVTGGTAVQQGSSVLDKLEDEETERRRWRQQQWLERYGNPRGRRGGSGGSGGSGGGGDSGGGGGHG